MSFELVAERQGVADFNTNIFTYGVLLGVCEELCGETFSAIELQPPQDNPGSVAGPIRRRIRLGREPATGDCRGVCRR